MAECPVGRCVDHENRLKTLEGNVKEIQSRLSSPAFIVALLGLVGTAVSGTMAFLGVVFAPSIQALLKAWFGF